MILYAIISQTESSMEVESIYTRKIKRDKKYEKIKQSNYENDGVLYYKSNVKLNGDLKGE